MFKLYYFDSAVAAAAEASGLKSTPKDLLNQHRNYQKIHNEKRAPLFKFEGKSMKTETKIWLEFLKGVKTTAKQILGILSALDETVSKTVHSKDDGDW